MPARLSVVIPSHNRADLLRLCLASVLRRAPAGTEVVVVDDASPDGAVSDAAAAFRGVRVLRQPRQGGFCAAANAGINAATHPIVELLNDDTEVEESWAEAALKWFNDPSVGAVAPLVLRHSGRLAPRVAGQLRSGWPTMVIDSAGDRYYLGGVAAKRGVGRPVDPNHLLAHPVFGASASSAFYRRAAVLAAGGFPESFGAYFEDVDLSFRLHRAGWRIVYEPAARVWHRVSASYGRPSDALLEQQAQRGARLLAQFAQSRPPSRPAAASGRPRRQGLAPMARGPTPSLPPRQVGCSGRGRRPAAPPSAVARPWLRPRLGRLGRRAAFLGMKPAARPLLPPLSVASPLQADSS